MKRITGLLAGLSLGLIAASPAMAQDDELSPFFIGVDYTFGSVTFFDTQDRTTGICGNDDTSCDRVKFSPDAARINVGMNLHPKFAIQAAYGRGNGSGDSNEPELSRVEVTSFYGIYGRASTPLEGFGGLRLGGIIGYSSAKVEVTPSDEQVAASPGLGTSNETVSGPSFGFELSFPIFGSSLLVADWMSLVDEDRVRISTVNAGFRFGFGGGEDDE